MKQSKSSAKVSSAKAKRKINKFQFSDDGGQRPDKFKNGNKVQMRNEYGMFDKHGYIKSAEYDPIRNRWMYTLEDYERKLINREFAERDLK